VVSNDGRVWWTHQETSDWVFRDGAEHATVVFSSPGGQSANAHRIATAIGLRYQHPDWSDKAIADGAQISASSLCKDVDYINVRNAFRNSPPPQGRRDADGNIESDSE
jgi:hypothetical protein